MMGWTCSAILRMTVPATMWHDDLAAESDGGYGVLIMLLSRTFRMLFNVWFYKGAKTDLKATTLLCVSVREKEWTIRWIIRTVELYGLSEGLKRVCPTALKGHTVHIWTDRWVAVVVRYSGRWVLTDRPSSSSVCSFQEVFSFFLSLFFFT